MSLDLPKDVLDEAVRRAMESQPIEGAKMPRLVKEILDTSSGLDLSGSLFLQFMYNRLEISRQAQYDADKAEKYGSGTVLNQLVRTIRVLYTETDKN